MRYYKKDPENNQVTIYQGIVYNVKGFIDTHPGGANYI